MTSICSEIIIGTWKEAALFIPLTAVVSGEQQPSSSKGDVRLTTRTEATRPVVMPSRHQQHTQAEETDPAIWGQLTGKVIGGPQTKGRVPWLVEVQLASPVDSSSTSSKWYRLDSLGSVFVASKTPAPGQLSGACVADTQQELLQSYLDAIRPHIQLLWTSQQTTTSSYDSSSNKTRGDPSSVRAHYNEVKKESKEERFQDPLRPLRNANAIAKSEMIRFAVQYVTSGRQRDGRQPLQVWEHACGSGGDLPKWDRIARERRLRIEWYGFDLADDCVKEATRRSSAFVRTMDMSIRQGDFTSLSLETAKSANSLTFDVIVCMLALHYHPKPADWFQVVAASLKPHGVVVIYILNRDRLIQAWKAIKSSTSSSSSTSVSAAESTWSTPNGPQAGDQWSNSVASITWTSPTTIRYTLGTRVQGLEENSWTPDEYIKWASSAGLTCIESRPAAKWGASASSSSAASQVSHLPRDQQQVFEFHHGLVFRKT